MTDAAFDLQPAAQSPIADLSYRGYDGPLHSRALRWWTISASAMRLSLRKPAFWIVGVIAALPYLFSGVTLYLQAAQGAPGGLSSFLGGHAHQFTAAFFMAASQQGLWIFLVALVVGAASIAADNRANALLIYLARPITRADYLTGKWVGIAAPVFILTAGPATTLYIFCLLALSGQGFWAEDHLLLLRALLAAAVPACIHASLLVGFSAWSKTPRIAGAMYAGLYFVSAIVSAIVWRVASKGQIGRNLLLQRISVSGCIEGLQQSIFRIDIHVPHFSRARGLSEATLHWPPAAPLALIAAATCAVALLAAHARIRAVEVVRG